jgi:hypothetical protein
MCRDGFTLMLLAGLAAGNLAAATLQGYYRADAMSGKTFDFSVLGTEDWAYWDETGDPKTGVPTNRKAGGAMIGTAYGVGSNSGVRGPSNRDTAPSLLYSFSDGMSPASGMVTNPVGLFNLSPNVASNGVGIVVNLSGTNTYRVTVFVSAFNTAKGLFRASIAGADAYVSEEHIAVGSSANVPACYTLVVTPDNAGDDLTITFVQRTDEAAYDFVLLNSVSVCLLASADLSGFFSGNASATGTYNLSALGTSDWVYWHQGRSGGATSNRRSGGSLISGAYIVGGTGLFRPSTNTINTTLSFTYTDGTSPASDTVSKPSGVYCGPYDVVGNGVRVNVNLPEKKTYIISVFVSSFKAACRLTAVLPGAPTYLNTEFYSSSETVKECAVYTLRATPQFANENMILTFVQHTDTSATVEYPILVGVAVRAAPPAGTMIKVH